MSIKVKNSLYEEVKQISHVMGMNEGELIDRAVLLYLHSIKELSNLHKELGAWDVLSDQSFVSMEAAL